jgi:NAD(P)-dependent dehydrogenase (short-subunit alcohol dehydrogenase family)
MNLSLEGKIAIVTGGSKGIGKATALSLAQEGVDVAICARGMADLEDSATEIRAATGRNVLPLQADMADPEAIKKMVAATVAEFGGVDILVNNAVNSKAAPFMELADEDWMNHINVKIMGYMRCAREVIPHMQTRGGGRIINIGGMAARSANTLANSNGVTNASVSNMAKNLSDSFASDGILVNCIHPGTTRTERQDRSLRARADHASISVEEAERSAVANIPIGRMVESKDIADLIVFLSSELAGAITGQTIAVEGGAGRGMNY